MTAFDCEPDLERARVEVAARVRERFGPRLDREVIDATVQRCADGFVDARIGQFVPVLVERRSIEALTAIVDAQQAENGSELP